MEHMEFSADGEFKAKGMGDKKCEAESWADKLTKQLGNKADKVKCARMVRASAVGCPTSTGFTPSLGSISTFNNTSKGLEDTHSTVFRVPTRRPRRRAIPKEWKGLEPEVTESQTSHKTTEGTTPQSTPSGLLNICKTKDNGSLTQGAKIQPELSSNDDNSDTGVSPSLLKSTSVGVGNLPMSSQSSTPLFKQAHVSRDHLQQTRYSPTKENHCRESAAKTAGSEAVLTTTVFRLKQSQVSL